MLPLAWLKFYHPMEEKKLDKNSIIGFLLIFGILLFMMWKNQPSEEELLAQKEAEKTQQVEEAKSSALTNTANTNTPVTVQSDSLQLVALQNKLGAFAYSASNKEELVSVESDVLALKFNTKGGHLSEVRLKNYVDFDSVPIYLVKDKNASFNLNIGTTDNRIFDTKDLVFAPKVFKNGDNTIVTMQLKSGENQFLEYKYIIKPNEYMVDFEIASQGLDQVLNTSKPVTLDWSQKAVRIDQSVSYENRYTRLTYMHDGDKIDKLSQAGNDTEEEEDVKWLSFRQHFFSSIMVAKEPFETVTLASKDLVKGIENEDLAEFTKAYSAKTTLAYNGTTLSKKLQLYYGPTDTEQLAQYKDNLVDSIPFGWGIFGFINKNIFVPLFAFLSGFLPYGFAIIVMTVLIKLLMSFVQYKQFLSQMKMKILKPELDAIREKHKDNKLKAQQETMALQTKAGASPLAGCLPALIQMPVFYALFMFFPVAFALRQKKFLWADDLSSYDIIYKFADGFSIPFYGDHVSLFPILAAVAIFFYMKLTTGQQAMSAPQQEGMPDMAKMMKYMIYFAPVMMLIFFNNYASGLSLYYFISNLISVAILLVIKHVILDENKVLAKIEANKAKPKKEGKFQKKMKEMMEMAEEQKRAQEQAKKK